MLTLSIRSLARHPRYALSFALPLALALAGSCTILALVRGVLLEPLPFREPERLVQIWERNEARGEDRTRVTAGDFYDWKGLQSFEHVAAYQPVYEAALSGMGDTRRVAAANGTYDLLDTLGVAPVAGRLYTVTDEGSGEDIVVVSDNFATEAFGSVDGAVGQTLVLGEMPRVVVGVIDSRQVLPVADVDVLVPISHSEETKENRKSHMLLVVGRLRSGVAMSEAAAELDLMMGRIRRDYPEQKSSEYAYMMPLHDEIVGDVRQPLTVLLTAVGILLLIAVANVSGLAVARARIRATELAVRRSLGASRLRMVMPMVAETMTLSVTAGVIAIGTATMGLHAAVTATADWVPRVRSVGLDAPEIIACLGAAVAAGILVSLATTMISLRSRGIEALHGSGRVGTSVTRDRVRAVAVIVQVAMSFVLLSGSAVLVRSMVKLVRTDPGHFTQDILTVDIDLPGRRYPDIDSQNRVFRDMVERISALPGVESAAATSAAPVTGARLTRSFVLDAAEVVAEGERRTYPYIAVTPGYFETMGIPLLRGRAFRGHDTADSPGVLVVNEAFARKESPGRDIVGRRLSFSDSGGPWYEIVGVVGNTRAGGPESEVEPQFFVPQSQRTWTWLDWATLVVRTDGDPARMVEPVRSVVREVEPALPVDRILTVEHHITTALGKRRFQLFLIAAFAALALILTVVGIHALIANALALRTREVGVRLALGAGPRDVVKLFAREGLTLVATGLGAGIALSAALMRFLEAMVVRLSPNDPLSVSAAVVLLLGVTGLSCYMPSRRAMDVDPAVVLRSE